MNQNILAFIAFAVAIQSVIVFLEVLVNFKKPLSFKIALLLVIFCVLIRAIGSLYQNYFDYNRWLVEVPGNIMMAVSLLILSLIFENRAKGYIITYCFSIVLLQIGIMFYFEFYKNIGNNLHLTHLKNAGLFILVIKVIVGFSAILINTWLFFRIKFKYNKENIYFTQLRKWSLVLLSITIIMCLNGLSRGLSANFIVIGEYILLIGHFSILLVFIFRPKFLNRTNLKVSLSNLFTAKPTLTLNEGVFMEVFFSNLYFIRREASADDLKSKLNVTSDELTNFIYFKYGLTITDLINKNRVNYLLDLINTGKYNNYTIDALAQEAGFSSRFHLYKSFRKFHGGTPSEYIKSVI